MSAIERCRSGFSMIGMLVTLVCILVLSTILLSSLNKAVTGEGSTLQNTVRSTQDQLQLYALYQSLTVHAYDNEGRFITPAAVAGTDDVTLNTSANLWSAMVMGGYLTPAQLISGNERSAMVWPAESYDYQANDPRNGIYWDTSFRADLDTGSNVSFAHVPQFGDRLRQEWKTSGNPGFPLIGNRGPRNGDHDPSSLTYGRNGQWAGYILYGGGQIQFADTFTPTTLQTSVGGQSVPDNIYRLEEGEHGRDAILSFTRQMTDGGPVLQFD